MGKSDAEEAAKAPKSSTAAQEQPPATSSTPATAAYPDWSNFQAYSPIPPHGFFPSPMASGSPAHPYMWGPQPMMHPYGTPPPPFVMYPHGVYAHPSIPLGSHPFSPYAMPSTNNNAEAFGATPGAMDVDGRTPEGKEKSPLKGSKGSLGSLNMITGKNNNDPGKTSGASANGGFSQSGESGSEGSSEGSDANSQNGSQPKTSGVQDSYDEANQNGNRAHSSRNGVSSIPLLAMNQTMPVMSTPVAGVPGAIAGPTTNLNIGMDFWAATTPSPVTQIRVKGAAGAVGAAMVSGSSSEIWMQDERELKRQRRKQSNRESARRSRLRKQAECEELAQRVEVLKEDNASLRAELNQIRKEYDQLLSQNTSLKERLGDTNRGSEGLRLERNGQHSLDDNHQRPMGSVIQAAQKSTEEGGQ